jgi:hypothetical protein
MGQLGVGVLAQPAAQIVPHRLAVLRLDVAPNPRLIASVRPGGKLRIRTRSAQPGPVYVVITAIVAASSHAARAGPSR